MRQSQSSTIENCFRREGFLSNDFKYPQNKKGNPNNQSKYGTDLGDEKQIKQRHLHVFIPTIWPFSFC
jgi:hypothetical protein